MEMPLGRMATAEDYELACKELCEALRFDFVVNYLAYGNRDLLFALAVHNDIFPNRVNGRKYITVGYGDHSQDMRVVPIKEHESKEDAVAFAIVLAITSKIEYKRNQAKERLALKKKFNEMYPKKAV